MKKFIYLLPVFFILLLNNIDVKAQNVGSPAPDFTLETLSGDNFNLSAQQGKVVFIFFFGYACPHCLANGPNTQSGIYEVFKDNPNFVAVGVDTWDGNNAGVSNFKSSTNVEYTLCLKGSAIESNYQTTYDRIVVVDKNGIIKYKATSDATSSVVAQASSVIESLLGSEMEEEEEEEMDEMMKEGMVTALNESANAKSKLLLFPVPVKSTINIDSDILEGRDFKVQIFDLNGKKVLSKNLDNNKSDNVSIPIPILADGFYTLQLTSQNYRITKKFIIRK